MVGVFYDFKGTNDYYVLVAAEDKYGHQQLDFLMKILVLSFLLGTALVWFSTYTFIRKQLKPLDDFQNKITDITALKLNNPLPVGKESDEITILTKAFNEMMIRIDTSFNAQKEFTANASHELRTPVSRLSLQLESVLRQGGHSAETVDYLKSMRTDLEQVGDLIQSLLLLARMNEQAKKLLTPERVDEVIFTAFDKVKKTHPDFHMNFEISGDDTNLEISGTKSLLEIVFVNLLRNAYLYSDDKNVNVRISPNPDGLQLLIENSGKTIPQDEQQKIFEPFMRGVNSGVIQGSGLGLRIVKRILDYHGASISYQSETSFHVFIVQFPQSI
ncbi:sensor histidine kinase [Flavobacterium silvaticum]|uniref:histidine kinase n=1 Tax=Flavobacterium silvaticum TaxID=1852020 RepID=A0A972JI90_9FLAO|nr:HAMP domain-containing sensor histidine kinase [Flavobacterium silvaticum]NMH27943.1 HAMP domain-containing histidine kinase [Flavobacterium silvaticum]